MKVEKIDNLINEEVKIISLQTTFLNIEFKNEFYRIDFDEKVEFHLKNGKSGILKIEEEHPLLIDYQENFVTTYINSPYKDIESFFNKLEKIIDIETRGMRDWKSYFEDKGINLTIDIIKRNVEKGYGKLCEAPLSITNKIVDFCNELNINTKTFYNQNLQTEQYKILWIGDYFVIAKGFKINLISSEKK